MDILYSCKDFTVCVKPAGTDSEVGMPQALSAALGGEFFPVHRLDANVGGIMVYARNKNACALLSRAFAEGKTEKEYVVVTTFYILFVVLYSFRKVCLTFYAKYTILFLQSKLCKKIVSAHL